MGTHTIFVNNSFTSLECCSCAVSFLVPSTFYNERLKDKRSFFCPSGHQQHFDDTSVEKDLRAQVSLLKRQLETAKKEPGSNPDTKELVTLRSHISDLTKELEVLRKIPSSKTDSKEFEDLKNEFANLNFSYQMLRKSTNKIAADFRAYKRGSLLKKPDYAEKTTIDEVLEEIKKNQKKPYEFGQ